MEQLTVHYLSQLYGMSCHWTVWLQMTWKHPCRDNLLDSSAACNACAETHSPSHLSIEACNISKLCIRHILQIVLLAMIKTNRTIKKFLRHTWALHFRGCSTLGPRVFWLYTICADFALGTSRNFEKLYQLSCESCIVYLNCLDFPKRVHSFLYGKSFWQHSTKLFLSMVWIITFALHCKVIEVKN